MSNLCFEKKDRLLKASEFQSLYRSKKTFKKYPLIVHYNLTDKSILNAKIGLSISKKVGNAVVRNKFKRLVRELFRHNKSKLPPVRFNISIMGPAKDFKKEDLISSLNSFFSKIS